MSYCCSYWNNAPRELQLSMRSMIVDNCLKVMRLGQLDNLVPNDASWYIVALHNGFHPST